MLSDYHIMCKSVAKQEELCNNTLQTYIEPKTKLRNTHYASAKLVHLGNVDLTPAEVRSKYPRDVSNFIKKAAFLDTTR